MSNIGITVYIGHVGADVTTHVSMSVMIIVLNIRCEYSI